MKHLLLALLALAAAPLVSAQPESAYYGVSLGNFDYEEESFGQPAFADTASSWRLMVGYQFMEHLGVEGGYGKTSTLRDTIPFAPGVDVNFRSQFKFLTIRLLGVLPFDNGLSLLGGLGYTDLEQEFAVNVSGQGEQSGEITGNEPAYYFGVQYDFDRFAVRLGYEDIDLGSIVDSTETSISFFYKL